MKTTTLVKIASLAILACQPAHASAPTDHGAYAISPEHPSTWVVGATRIRQGLRWDERRRVLIADVKYSTRDWADSIHPAQEDDFSLSFPSVRFDPATRNFTAHGVAVGTLRNGFLGPEVVLNPEVALSIHRHHGIVNAALIREDVTNY